MITKKILIVDDEPDIRNLIKEILEDEYFEVEVAEDADQANSLRHSFNPALILLDIWMPGTDGITLLKQWKEAEHMEDIPIIMISGHGTVESAVEATRLGAYDFIEKPLSLNKLILTVKHALEQASLSQENKQLKAHQEYADIPVGKSEMMKNLRQQISQIVDHTAPVLITGESGTDKESFARYIHKKSARVAQPFVSVNVSALSSENLLTDFFGNNASNTTGNSFFERAEKGTLFFKDIASMPPALQAKLKDALDNKCFTSLGGTQAHTFDIRIIAATSHDILSLVNQNLFRDALYYQLNVLPIHIPPLREHIEDIPELLEFYVNFFTEKEGLPYRHFTVSTQNHLRNYSWPGNIRELKNLVQRLLILCKSEHICIADADRALGHRFPKSQEQSFINNFDMPLREAREQFEKKYLLHKLELAGGNVSKAAIAVGIERTHLYRKLKSLDIEIKVQHLK